MEQNKKQITDNDQFEYLDFEDDVDAPLTASIVVNPYANYSDTELIAHVEGVLNGTVASKHPLHYERLQSTYFAMLFKKGPSNENSQDVPVLLKRVSLVQEGRSTTACISDPPTSRIRQDYIWSDFSNADTSDVCAEAFINEEEVQEDLVEINCLSTAPYGPAMTKRHVMARLAVALVDENENGLELISLPKTSKTIADYLNTQNLRSFQQALVPIIKNVDTSDEILHKIQKMSNQQIKETWQLMRFPAKMGYLNDNKTCHGRIPRYNPTKVMQYPPPSKPTTKLLVEEIDKMRSFLGTKKAFGNLAKKFLHGISVSSAVLRNMTTLSDIQIPKNVRIVNLLGVKHDVAIALRNLHEDDKILFVECSDHDLDLPLGRIIVDKTGISKILHTTLLAGQRVKQSGLVILNIDMRAPPAVNINKQAIMYKNDLIVAQKKLQQRQNTRICGKTVFWQYYVTYLDVINGMRAIPSAHVTKGYVIHRSWQTGFKAKYLLRLMLTVLRYAACYPYHLLTRQTFTIDKVPFTFSFPEFYDFRNKKKVIETGVGDNGGEMELPTYENEVDDSIEPEGEVGDAAGEY